MEREQIIKALECCTYGGDKTKSQVEVCSPCPYFNEGNCTDVLKESALALIKELTEENEKLTVNMNAYGLTAKRLAENSRTLLSSVKESLHAKEDKAACSVSIYDIDEVLEEAMKNV